MNQVATSDPVHELMYQVARLHRVLARLVVALASVAEDRCADTTLRSWSGLGVALAGQVMHLNEGLERLVLAMESAPADTRSHEVEEKR